METKKKVLSIRVKEELGDLLKKKAEDNKMKVSKYVRKLIKNDLGFNRLDTNVINLELDSIDHDMLETKASKNGEAASLYVKRIIKMDLVKGKESITIEADKEQNREYQYLKKDHEKLKRENDELKKEKGILETEKRNLEETVSDLSKFKDDVLNQLVFLMSFFQKNSKLLQKHDREFILKNRDRFAIIAKQLEGKS